VSIFFSPREACLHVSLVLPRESELRAFSVVLNGGVIGLDLIFPKKVTCQVQDTGAMKHSIDSWNRVVKGIVI
jgi:hypothetical protein